MLTLCDVGQPWYGRAQPRAFRLSSFCRRSSALLFLVLRCFVLGSTWGGGAAGTVCLTFEPYVWGRGGKSRPDRDVSLTASMGFALAMGIPPKGTLVKVGSYVLSKGEGVGEEWGFAGPIKRRVATRVLLGSAVPPVSTCSAPLGGVSGDRL